MLRSIFSLYLLALLLLLPISAAHAYADLHYTLATNMRLHIQKEHVRSYASSDPAVASVSADGVVTPHKAGDAVISLERENGVQRIFIHVVPSEYDLAREKERRADTSGYAAEVLRLVNEERRKHGLRPLLAHARLERGAAIRVRELLVSFSHTRPDGRSCATVGREVGIDSDLIGENIGAGFKTPAEAVAGWMESPGHRANILHPRYRYLAAGYLFADDAPYRRYWVQLFLME